MIEPQSMQEGASAWFTKLARWELPEPPATAPATAWAAGASIRGDDDSGSGSGIAPVSSETSVGAASSRSR